MRDVDYTILERRIRRLERLIANEQLDQKNEFLGLGKKKPEADHSERVLSIFSKENYNFELWKKRNWTNGWRDDSRPGYIDLSLMVSNERSMARTKVTYNVTLEGKDLKKIKLRITRKVKGGDEEVIYNKAEPLVKPDQIRRVSAIITENIDPGDFE